MEKLTPRKELAMTNNLKDILIVLSEGNPGALRVMMDWLQKDGDSCFMSFLNLDDMNIRGSQIWVGFKDHCKEDMSKFIECVNSRDEDMVNTINREFITGNHKAVTSGASSERRGFL